MDFLHILHLLNELIRHSANQWWVVPLVMLFCLIDGFFVFLPSETAIVALASISAKYGHPNIWVLLVGGAIGAIMGDNVAYYLGHKLGTERFKWMRKPRGAKAFSWARKELDKRGAILIFTARYIPVGRIAVNFTAGATRFSWRRFVLLDAIAAFTWATYSVSVGVFAGRWVHNNPLLGVVIAVAFAIIIGFIVDHVMKFVHNRMAERTGGAGPAAGSSAGSSTGSSSSSSSDAGGASGGTAAAASGAQSPAGAAADAQAGPASPDCHEPTPPPADPSLPSVVERGASLRGPAAPGL